MSKISLTIETHKRLVLDGVIRTLEDHLLNGVPKHMFDYLRRDGAGGELDDTGEMLAERALQELLKELRLKLEG